MAIQGQRNVWKGMGRFGYFLTKKAKIQKNTLLWYIWTHKNKTATTSLLFRLYNKDMIAVMQTISKRYQCGFLIQRTNIPEFVFEVPTFIGIFVFKEYQKSINFMLVSLTSLEPDQ